MKNNTDKAVDKALRKVIDDETIKPEEKRLLMQYMEEMRKDDYNRPPATDR